MKKKIVNLLLSVAVVTSMMFAVTACGSKEVSLDEWVVSEEASEYTDQLNSMASGLMTTSFETDGDVLLLVFTYSDDLLGIEDVSALTEEQKDILKESMQQEADSQAGSADMKEAYDEIAKLTGISDIKVRAVYKLSDGTEMCSIDL